MVRSRHRAAIFCTAAVMMAALHSCGRMTKGLSAPAPVILISIDTLRSDHLPAYGYRGVATPNIDALRADSILYERAYSHCPLTLPSHSTILTGRLPADTGVRDNLGYRLGEVPTLAELLKKNGYATGAAVSAFVLRRESGIDRGFDFYDDDVEPIGRSEVIGMVQRRGEDTVASANRWIDSHAAQPFFFFLHLYEPHTPYDPPEPFASRYPNRYDGEIAHVDQIVGTFLADLKNRGLYDKAMIILLSDHGEGLNEHGEEEHGIFLYREALQVPLLVKLPHSAAAGKSVGAPAELTDVFPTILEETRTPAPASHEASAESLLALMRPGAPVRRIYSETYYPRLHFGWSDLHSLIDGAHHYIRAPQPELYDVAADPQEKRNVMSEDRRTYAAMRGAIDPYVRKAAAPAVVDPEEVAKLAALGYVGSTVATSDDEVLPDPKTTVGVFRDIRTAYTLFRDEKPEQALALTRRLLHDNQRIIDLWDLESKILGRLGRNEEAIEAAREGLRRQPDSVALIITIANLSILTGKLDQAAAHAELLMKSEPARGHEILARVYAQRGDFPNATAQAKMAMNGAHDVSPALLALGLIEKQQGHLESALRYFDEAQEKIGRHRDRNLPNLHFYRGDVLARLGRQQEAEREFRAEIAAYPTHPDAYAALILLLSAQRRVDEATGLVFNLVKTAPSPPAFVAISETLKAVGDDRGAEYWAVQGLKRYPSNQELRNLLRRGAATPSS